MERTIIAVQAYITAATRELEAKSAPGAMSINYFRLLRHVHAELSKQLQ
ncbi:MAG: hypothetical protein ACKVQR_16605 [Aquabacterium sp.]